MDSNTRSTEEQLITLLKEQKRSITTVESCTGGKVAARLVSVAGASEVFFQGLITYANEAKQRLAGVSSETLARYGAVSPETAKEMVRGANRIYGTDVALSVTGIAGPDGGTAEKPVGLVYIGCAVGDAVTVKRLNLTGDRESIRNQSADAVLQMTLECLQGRWLP